MSPINLDRIQEWIQQGRLDPNQPITLRELLSSRAVGGIKDGVKLLGNGATEWKIPIHIVVSKASQSAIAAVEKAGGTVTTRFYTKRSIRQITRGQSHPYISLRWDPTAINVPALHEPGSETPEQRVKGVGYEYRLPDPTQRSDIEYYRDAKNRGYLAHTVQEGEGPSLYFKPPVSEQELRELKRRSARKIGEARKKEENKLW